MNELERQKLLEQLGENQDRSPASYSSTTPQLKGPQQGPPSPFYQNESISNEPINLPAEAPQVGRISDEEAALAANPSARELSNRGNVGGDMMVGASHALLGLLSGNFNRAAMEYGKADQYLSGQRAQDIKNLSNLKTVVGPTGAPTYVPAIDAADQQAYVKPMMKTYAPQYLKNTKTGEVKPASWNGRDFVSTDPEGNPVILSPNEWFKYQPDKVLRAVTPSGGVSFTGYNPVTQGLSNIKTTQGLGDIVTDESGKPLPKQVAEANIKTASKSAGKVADLYEGKAGLQHALSVIKDPNSTGAALSSAMEEAKKSMLGQRLSSYESARFEGDQYNTLLQNLQNFASKKVAGTPADFKRDQFAQMIQGGIDELNSKIGARSGVAGQIKGLSTGTPQPSKASQAKLIQYDRAAAAKWGKGSDLYNQFMAKKKQELGM